MYYLITLSDRICLGICIHFIDSQVAYLNRFTLERRVEWMSETHWEIKLPTNEAKRALSIQIESNWTRFEILQYKMKIQTKPGGFAWLKEFDIRCWKKNAFVHVTQKMFCQRHCTAIMYIAIFFLAFSMQVLILRSSFWLYWNERNAQIEFPIALQWAALSTENKFVYPKN